MPSTTHIGKSEEAGGQGALEICAEAHDKPGLLILQSIKDDGTLIRGYIWLDGTGAYRVNDAEPEDQDADGTVITTS